MEKVPFNDALFAKAFRLAYFIHCDREVALQIATEACSKLEVACAAQDKRLYYTPTGRTSSRVSRTKVSLSEPHLLQRLVYIGSEARERQREEAGRVSGEEMIIYYIKHLVRITAKRNSFYVALGLSRLLHNYSTMETAQLYGLVIQDPDRVPDDYYHRSRKGRLMREMKDRFGNRLGIVKGQRGEERFQTQETTMKIRELVKNCLRAFTPWGTPCVVPEGHDPLSETIPHLSFDGDDPDQEHDVEVNRIHSILHPNCYERLTDSLGLDLPEARLGIPWFGMSSEGSGRGSDRSDPPDVSENELNAIRVVLAQESARRRVAAAGLMKVIVDGAERARFDPRKASGVKLELGSDAELIEVHSSDERGDVVLAVFITDFESSARDNLTDRQSITLEGGQKLSFSTSLLKDSRGEIEGAAIEIAYSETGFARAALLSLNRIFYRASNLFGEAEQPSSALWKPALALALLAVLIGGVFFALRSGQPRNEDGPIAEAPQSSVSPEPNNNLNQSGVAKNEENQKPSDPSQPQQPQPKVMPEDEKLLATNKPPVEPDPKEISSGNSRVRSVSPRIVGAALPEVVRIRIQVSGDDEVNHRVQQILADALNSTERFTAVESIDEAQAELKVSVIGDPESKKGALIVRLVNESGYVLWPVNASGSGAKYTGSANEIAPVMMGDLMRASAKQDRVRK